MSYPAPEQYMAALDVANQIRVERAQLRRRVSTAGTFRDSCRELAGVLSEAPACLDSMRVEQAVRWVHRMTQARTSELLAGAGCSHLKRVRDLTPRQRDLIIETLMDWAYDRVAA